MNIVKVEKGIDFLERIAKDGGWESAQEIAEGAGIELLELEKIFFALEYIHVVEGAEISASDLVTLKKEIIEIGELMHNRLYTAKVPAFIKSDKVAYVLQSDYKI